MQNEKQLTELEMQSKGRKVFMLMVVFFCSACHRGDIDVSI